MVDNLTVNDLIYMLQREVANGNGNKYIRIPKTKFTDIKNVKFSSDIGIVYGSVHNQGNCVLLIGD